MSLIKSILYSVLNKSNYELRNKNKVSNYIEINQSDRKLIELILRNNLSPLRLTFRPYELIT